MMTAPRRELLREACDERGVYAVQYYQPLQWALTMGYVETFGRGANRYRITDAGREALAELGEP